MTLKDYVIFGIFCTFNLKLLEVKERLIVFNNAHMISFQKKCKGFQNWKKKAKYGGVALMKRLVQNW